QRAAVAREQAAVARQRARMAESRAEAREYRERELRYRAIAGSCPPIPAVHFDTPEAMMSYLADAWNRNDLGALCAVSTPDARTQLVGMREEAENLRLTSCSPAGDGAYFCHLVH